MEKFKNKIYTIMPYLILLIFSFLSTYLLFIKGINNGDDIFFHLGNIYDEYKTILDGEKLSPISGNIALGLGVGTRLFYSPFSHFFVMLIALITKLFNASFLLAYKIVIILSVFISGIFMYRFMMHISKNNKIASLISACAFVIYPYRLFDSFCRSAFAETIAIMFLPLFFMGLYDVTHFKDQKINIIAFVEIIISGSLLYLTHNITALYAYIAGIIYLLVKTPSIIKLFKNIKYSVYCVTSIFLLIGIASFAFVSQFELLHTDLYNICNPSVMWTDLQHVLNRLKEQFNYSGFINLPFLKDKFSNYLTISSLILGIILYLLSTIIFIVIDILLSKVKKLKYFHTLISSVVLFSLVSITSRRIEIYFATIIFIILYLFIIFTIKHINETKAHKKIYKDSMFYYCIAMIVLCFFMMQFPYIWKILPDFMLNIQFPWRLWALVQLFASILIGVIIYHFSLKKIISYVFIVLIGLMFVTNMPLLEKRLTYTYNKDSSWINEVDDSILKYRTTLGHNKEYIPQVFFDNNYNSEYDNSLYDEVKYILNLKSFFGKKEYEIDPTIIKGEGAIVVNKAYSPTYKMQITLSQDSTIQMPLIYYPGYEIIIMDLDDNSSYTITPTNIDGLISFSLESGNYKVESKYVGTTLRKTSKVIFAISTSITLLALLYGLFIENGKYKKLSIVKK